MFCFRPRQPINPIETITAEEARNKTKVVQLNYLNDAKKYSIEQISIHINNAIQNNKNEIKIWLLVENYHKFNQLGNLLIEYIKEYYQNRNYKVWHFCFSNFGNGGNNEWRLSVELSW